MENQRCEVFDIINNVTEITKEIYEELISKYDKAIVDSIIEIQMEEKDVHGFEYYLDLKLKEFEDNYDSSDNVYMRDINYNTRFNSSDNKKYLGDLKVVVNRLNSLFSLLGYEKEICGLSIIEKVNYCIDKCNDNKYRVMISDLFSRYVSVRNKIIIGNLDLVISVAKTYFKNNSDCLEMIQNGNEGLIEAVDRYNPNLSTQFSTYASIWIRRNILKGLRTLKTSVTVPSYIYDFNNLRLQAINELTDKLDRCPNDIEVADYMKIPLSKLYEIKGAFDDACSLTDLENDELDNYNESEEYIVDSDFDMLELYVKKQKNIEIIRRIKKCLTDIEYLILAKRYGLEDCDKATYEEIGLLLGISISKVNSIYKKSLKKIKNNCSDLLIYL